MSGEKHHVRARQAPVRTLPDRADDLARCSAALFLLGIVVLFQQSKSSALQDEQIARMQENGRYALRVLSRELSMMNYFGGMIDIDTGEPLQFESKLDNEDGCNADWLLEIDTPLEFSDKDDAPTTSTIPTTPASTRTTTSSTAPTCWPSSGSATMPRVNTMPMAL